MIKRFFIRLFLGRSIKRRLREIAHEYGARPNYGYNLSLQKEHETLRKLLGESED